MPINEDWAKKLTAYLGTTISQLLFDYDLYVSDVPEKYHDRIDEWERLQKERDDAAQGEFYGNDRELFHPFAATFEEEALIIKYRCIDSKGKHVVNTVLEMENNRCKQDHDHLTLNAAHERTDIEVTDEMKKHDDDIMNDDDFWK